MANVYSYSFDSSLPLSYSSGAASASIQVSGSFTVDYDNNYSSDRLVSMDITVGETELTRGAIFVHTNQSGVVTYNLFAYSENSPSGIYFNAYYNGRSPTSFVNVELSTSSVDYSVFPQITQSASYRSPGAEVQSSIVCYASGTRILTQAGEVSVDILAVGDTVVTASGERRPIRWIGHRTIDCRNHATPQNVQPVRIAAGALGENRPLRDLVVSPGHAICLDVLGKVLIPASVLVNGTTIVQEQVDSVTYWHVELDSHDILIAEGQPAESYLDMGNRAFFGENGVVSLIAAPDIRVPTHADFCRPFHDGGVVVEAVRALAQARAESLGWYLDDAPLADMHLVVDGVRIEADMDGLVARFALPASARDVWLVSETSIPREIGLSADSRRLGLCLCTLSLTDGAGSVHPIALDDARLCLGFHKGEPDHRWTAGRARLPTDLFAGCVGAVSLQVELAGPALPRWIAPRPITLAQAA